MAFSKTIFLFVALAMTVALTIVLTSTTITQVVLDEGRSAAIQEHEQELPQSGRDEDEGEDDSSGNSLPAPSSRRLSRFLAEEKDNPAGRGSQNCQKLCKKEKGKRKHCCNDKCIDKNTDHNNCGKCGKKCKYTETCCKGHCVNLSMDKKNCGACRHRCHRGRRSDMIPACVQGMCNYA